MMAATELPSEFIWSKCLVWADGLLEKCGYPFDVHEINFMAEQIYIQMEYSCQPRGELWEYDENDLFYLLKSDLG